MAANYNSLGNDPNNLNASPYGSGDPYYAQSTGFITPQNAPVAKKGVSKWVKIGIPVAVIVIAAAVVGGVLGSKKASEASSSGSGGSGGGGKGGNGGNGGKGGSGSIGGFEGGRFATATDSLYLVPIYPSATAPAFSAPTFAANSKTAWPADPFQPSNPSPTVVRTDRPRIIAPAYKWEALPGLIAADPYLRGWNDTIFGNATTYFNAPPVPYFYDGGNGILDIAREIKVRLKAFGYAYRMSTNTRWVDRAWMEIENAARFGTTEQPGWNTGHFLDTAELASAFGIAYDWMYDGWKPEQRDSIRETLLNLGLRPGLSVFTEGATFGWWSAPAITGNWNCVCNAGLTLGALAILGDDTTGVAEQLLAHTVQSAKGACVNAVADDGTWRETPNYWYFGSTGHAEMAGALLSATGSDYGLLTENPNFSKVGDYHMGIFGPGSLFSYGDSAPNKFSATANSMFLYGDRYEIPRYTLFQREQFDAAEPWSMFWYDPSVSGAFWNGAPLDMFFNNEIDQWASMRSSWTDIEALYVAIKAGIHTGHQTHNDLDAGTFVLDALGTRWAGELGNSNYNSPNYFNNGDDQNADRWKYYRKMTAGQNTLLVNRANQNVLGTRPTVRSGSSGTTQESSTVFNAPKDSTAFWVADLSTAYTGANSIKRGIRLLNGRKQVLLQDEIDSGSAVQWRMHTNATVSANGPSATLSLDGQTMQISILDPPSGAVFTTAEAVRFPSDGTPPEADPPNPGVTVLVIELPAGQHNLQVLFNPQWAGMSGSDFVTPSFVALDSWSVTSHN